VVDRGNGGSGGGSGTAVGLGVLSVALGVLPTVAPAALARAIGVRPTDGTTRLLRAIGIRELAAAGLLLGLRSPALAWVRVAGDAMDLPLAVRAAVRARGSAGTRGWSTVGVLAAITAVDVAAALTSRPAGQAAPIAVSSAPATSPADYTATSSEAASQPDAKPAP
jgi:hypothetical protein